jgi:(1->4)-alpha-D-glucan 1-alpha-D-glucosylmutase
MAATGNVGTRQKLSVSTYRLQFNRFFAFAQATELVDYLDRLGIGDCYASPLLMARPGSLHGYDITDHSRLNPEIGTDAELRAFAAALRERGMGLLLDIVPNHMCVAHPSNVYWWDVLENGPSSPFARFFDIDWRPPKDELAGKVLLPVLGDQYGRVLENQEIAVIYEDGAFYCTFYETRLPIAPHSWRLILEPAAAAARASLGESHPDVLELESILTALSHLPPRTETDEGKVRERQREKEIIKRRLETLIEANEEVRRANAESLRTINGTKGDERSFDLLERLLADQAYRLSFWRVAADEINYRRFFDIDALAAIRPEDPVVFDASHALVFDLIRRGDVTGLRVDHPDGLFEPEKYFDDLQRGCLNALGDAAPERFFVVAEKILLGDERLPGWAIQGTTGYDALNDLNGLFVRAAKKAAFFRLYRGFTGWSEPYQDLLYQSKRLMLQVSMSSELNVLARSLDRISEQHRWSRDFTLHSLYEALREVIACFPIYRTYLGSQTPHLGPEDERHIRFAIDAAKRRNPATSESIFDFIRGVLLVEHPDGITEDQRTQRRLFAMRLQQFTAPVMAKGLEDTTFYRFFPLASLNEVGGDPRAFGVPLGVFHSRNQVRSRLWPNTLVATSTHDTKRGEDVRARINVLSEIPAEWYRAIRSWQRLNRRLKTQLAEEAPSANEEYLFYQTLVGAWPLKPMDSQEHGGFVARIQAYMEKALREAKLHTSWISPNAPYEEAVRRFVASALDPAAENGFLSEFVSFQNRIVRAGMLNSLSQVLLKTVSPGVPDFYQGAELWGFSLVDPDNRRLVDYTVRRCLLEELDARERDGAAALVERLIADPSDGAIKLYVTSRALRFRRTHQELFARGGYVPVRGAGDRQSHLTAFARTYGDQSALALAGRFFMDLGAASRLPVGEDAWGDTVAMFAPAPRPRTVARRVHRPTRQSGSAKRHMGAAPGFRFFPPDRGAARARLKTTGSKLVDSGCG